MAVWARAALALGAILAALEMCHAQLPFSPAEIHLLSFTTSRDVHARGKSIMLTAKIDVKTFGNNNLTYCGFRNENNTATPPVVVNIGGAGIRFHPQRVKNKAKWFIAERRSFGKIIWEFTPEGYAITQGKTYTMRANVKLAPNTVQDSYVWRVYCETPAQPENIYPFGKVYKTLPIVARNAK